MPPQAELRLVHIITNPGNNPVAMAVTSGRNFQDNCLLPPIHSSAFIVINGPRAMDLSIALSGLMLAAEFGREEHGKGPRSAGVVEAEGDRSPISWCDVPKVSMRYARL